MMNEGASIEEILLFGLGLFLALLFLMVVLKWRREQNGGRVDEDDESDD